MNRLDILKPGRFPYCRVYSYKLNSKVLHCHRFYGRVTVFISAMAWEAAKKAFLVVRPLRPKPKGLSPPPPLSL